MSGRWCTTCGSGVNCDICTPHFLLGPDAYNLDLCIDVLVGPDGRRHQVIDEDHFAEATRLGWLSEAERAGALAGVSELLRIIESEGLVAFLEGVCPFQHAADSERQPPMERRPISAFPKFQPTSRRWGY